MFLGGFITSPEAVVKGNAVVIADGETVPATGNNTDFGNTLPGSPVTRTFVIENTGNDLMTVTGVTLTGANAADFSISSAPASPVAAAGSTSFTVSFNPSFSGLRTAVIHLNNSDCNEADYDFVVQGTGSCAVLTAGISGSTTICGGGNATLTFSATPNTTIDYNVNGGANQTIAAGASGTATQNVSPVVNSTFTVTGVTDAYGCTTVITGAAATVTINPSPVAAISGTTTICGGGSTNITFSGTANAIVTYNANGGSNQTINLDGAGSATLNVSPAATTTYTVTNVTNSSTSCSAAVTGQSATVTINPAPTAGISGSAAICSGASTALTFNGTANALVTYKINGGADQTIALNGAGAATLSVSPVMTSTYMVTASASGSCTAVITGQSATVTINASATATISGSATVCSGNSTTITFNGTANASVAYNANGGTNQTIILNGSGVATLSVSPTVNTTYTVTSATNTATNCTSAITGQSATVTINSSTTAAISGTATVCAGNSTPITFSGTPNASVSYNVNGGSNQVIVLNGSGSATLSVTPSVTSTYTVTSVTYMGCTSTITGQSATVTRVSVSATAAVTPLYPMPGQEIQTVYVGYPASAQSETIGITPAGGTGPYGYSWSRSAVNGATLTPFMNNSNSFVFTPSASDAVSATNDNIYTFSVTVTDNAGCSSAAVTKKINVVNPYTATGDVRICHRNVSRGSTTTQLMELAPSAVATHLAHGDYLGNCQQFAGAKQIAAAEEEDGIHVYPNPTTGTFKVELPVVKESADILVTDVQGKIVSRQVLAKDSAPVATFNLSGFAAGMYLVQVRDGEMLYRAKIVLR